MNKVKIVAASGHLQAKNCTKINLRRGWGSLQRSPRPPSWWGGGSLPLSRTAPPPRPLGPRSSALRTSQTRPLLVSYRSLCTFHTILALCTCLYRSHLRKPVSMKKKKNTAESQRLKIYVQNVHHFREHMHSNDYITAQSLPR